MSHRSERLVSETYRDYLAAYTDYDTLPESRVAIEPQHRPLIPPGQYQAKCLGYRTARGFDANPKIYLDFAICDGPHIGAVIFRPYGVKAIKGTPRVKGAFVMGRGGDLAWDIRQAFGKKPFRSDRIPLGWMRHILWEIQVLTVERDYRQRELPEENRYSRIYAYRVLDGFGHVNEKYGCDLCKGMTFGRPANRKKRK